MSPPGILEKRVRRFQPRSDCGACQIVYCTDELYIPPIHHFAAQRTRLAHPIFTSSSQGTAVGNSEPTLLSVSTAHAHFRLRKLWIVASKAHGAGELNRCRWRQSLVARDSQNEPMADSWRGFQDRVRAV
jgi:hypothetical protein